MKLGKVILTILLCTLLAASVLAQKKMKESELLAKYQEWLKLVAHIIIPQEKDVFLQLQNDFDRDIFIEAFWKQRDPTPGTPQNEYKEEISKRFLYVNKEFSKGTPRPGWMTDRGRIYMILGAPQNRERMTMPELQPCELWTYYGDTSMGQPTYFGLIFFRRGGIGEYTLYSPMADGPKSLLLNTGPTAGINLDNQSEVYQMIQDYAPTLAPFTLSITPQDTTLVMEPSTQSEILMAQILDSPRKKINPSYATHFLNYKGVVSTEYLTNFVDSEAIVAVMRDPVEKIPFLHYSIAPKSISIDFYAPENQYYCSYAVDASLKQGETFIYQSAKDFTYYFPPADSAMVAANGLVIQDTFPVIEGKFRLTVLLRNSVGKEFSLLEKDVVIESAKSPRIGAILVGYKMENVRDDSLMAFTLQGQKLLTDPKNTFTPADTIMFFYQVEDLNEDLWRRGEIRVTVRGLRAASPSEKKLTSALSRKPFRPILGLELSLPASELTPDYYEAAVSLVDGGKVIDEAKATFIISTASALARPIILAKTLPRARIHLQYLELAGQAEKVGNRVAAEAYFQRAMSLAPADPEVAVYYCSFLMRSKNFQKALEHVEKVKADPALQFNYFLIKGKALRELGRCEEAIPLLLEGNKIYNSDTRLLNALGYCLYRTGQKGPALEALNASLRLNSSQEDIKKLVEEIRKD